MCVAKRHVRITPNSDRESVIPEKVMSALLSRADICGAKVNVRFGPKADIEAVDREPCWPFSVFGHNQAFSSRMRLCGVGGSDFTVTF